MNAQDLLDRLLEAKLAGVDLATLELVVEYSVYDGLGQCEDCETYPSEVVIDETYFTLT
jgi:hypothetical protein